MEAIVVPCTREKSWGEKPDAGPVVAQDAYTKPVFLKWKDYAERSGSDWFILGTRSGLLTPDHL